MYLLQLVQALKYENFDEIRNKSEKDYIPPRPEYDPGRRDSDVALQQPGEPVVGLDQHPLSQTLTTSLLVF